MFEMTKGNRHYTASSKLFHYDEALEQKVTACRAEHGNRGAGWKFTISAANILQWGKQYASVIV
jgi:hypothetical protein